MENNKTIVAARAYVERGLAVFPLNGKIPLTEHGVKDATLDLDLVTTWFKQPRNIGIALPDGAVVVDVDPRNGGLDSFTEWTDSYGTQHWENVPNARTGGGGDHYWFRLPPGTTRLKKNPAPGIDLLTTGRYVVAPPSITDDKYVWTVTLPADLDQLNELPGFVVMLATPEELVVAAIDRPDRTGPDPLRDAIHAHTTWDAILARHGWRHVGGPPGSQDGARWRHPNSTNPFSATFKHGNLFVYSPNTPFPVTESGSPHGITLWTAVETLDYHGNRNALVDELVIKGHLREKLKTAEIDQLLVKKPNLTVIDGGRPDNEPTGPRLTLTSAEGLIPARVRWVWDGRIPAGSLTLLAGREGEGKSTVAIGLAAELTRGQLDGEYWNEPKDIIIIASEDSWTHTIGPRLLAARADMKRVFFIEMLDPLDVLSLPVDIPDLELACAKRDVALVIMDPLLSRLSGRLDTHKDADVRRALEPLVSFAERIHAAILGLIHLNKSGATDPLEKIMASKAFTAVARSVLYAMIDPEDETRRLLGLVKANLGRLDLPTLTYTFDAVKVGEDDGDIIATRIAWGEPAETSIRTALEIPAENRSDIELATEWLGTYLVSQGGSATTQMVQKAAKEHLDRDVKTHTLRRALQKLNGESKPSGLRDVWVWRLPGAS